MKEQETKIPQDEEYLNNKFPKGFNVFRGEAMVLIALAREEGAKQEREKVLKEELEFCNILWNQAREYTCDGWVIIRVGNRMDKIKQELSKLQNHCPKEQKYAPEKSDAMRMLKEVRSEMTESDISVNSSEQQTVPTDICANCGHRARTHSKYKGRCHKVLENGLVCNCEEFVSKKERT